MSVINSRSFGRFWPVSWTITLFLGPGVISMIDEHRGAFVCQSSTLAVLAILAHFVEYYLVSGSRSDFHDLRTPWCVFVLVNDTHNFGQFLVRLVHYYSPFRRPRAISTIYKPRGAFAVLANSDAFCGLLVTVFWS